MHITSQTLTPEPWAPAALPYPPQPTSSLAALAPSPTPTASCDLSHLATLGAQMVGDMVT